MKKVTIFGGSGFLGSAIVRCLTNLSGHHVKVVDNFSRNFRDQSMMPSVTVVKGDVLDRQSVIDSVRGAETVINLAYINGTASFYERPLEVAAVAVRGQMNIIDAINQSDSVKEFIYASSSEVYADPPEIPTAEEVPLVIPSIDNERYSYSGGKIFGEYSIRYLLKPGLKGFVFRPHNIYGANMGREHVIPQLLGRIFQMDSRAANVLDVYGPLDATRSFCHIDDFQEAFRLIYLSGFFGTINIGSGVEDSIDDLLRVLRRVTGVQFRINTLDPRSGSPLRRCPDITLIRELGFSPRVDLESGVRECWEALC